MTKINDKETVFDIEASTQNSIVWIFIILAGFMLPLLLIPVVMITGYTEVVEEIAKAIVVLLLVFKLPTSGGRLFAGFVLGLLFGLSETMFYLTSIIQMGDINILWQRLLFTVPMHIMTVLIMVISALWRKWLFIFGFIYALTIHLLFNFLI